MSACSIRALPTLAPLREPISAYLCAPFISSFRVSLLSALPVFAPPPFSWISLVATIGPGYDRRAIKNLPIDPRFGRLMPTLEIGSFQSRTCQGMTRRALLSAGVAAPFALASSANARSSMVAEPGKARSILLVWLGGGPSHLDLFDPKPKAPVEYRGPFATIATRTARRSIYRAPAQAGGPLTQVLADSQQCQLSRRPSRGGLDCADRQRSAATAIYPPNFGSIVARKRGHDALPRFISLARGPIGDGVGPIQGYGGGTWGKGIRPLPDRLHRASGQVEIPSLKLADGLSPERLADRRLLARRDRPRPARCR